ncbi:MAG: hypothetical protein FJ387_19185 [Verrucomicrobia bacterium]|nr:hypothetical protein [Verrucomicrobiota bacterium]
MRKPRRQLVLAWAVIAAAVLWSVYDWIFVTEGFRYFAEDWARLLVLCGIVLVGTPLLLGYQMLSTERRRQLGLWAIGVLAAAATGLALHCSYSMLRLADFFRETGELWLVLIATLFPAAIAVCLWWVFSRIWYRKPV